MKSLVLTATLTITLAALGVLLGPKSAHAAGDAAAGKDKAATCVACHGVDGNSPAPVWPKIAGQNAKYLVKQLREFKSGARQAAQMQPMVANLSEQDMEDIAAYFATQTPTGGFVSEAIVAEGERLYRGGNKEAGIASCAACHGPAGEGDPLAGTPALAGQHATYTAAQLLGFRSGARGNDPAEMMRRIARWMTDAQIEAVAAYAAGLH